MNIFPERTLDRVFELLDKCQYIEQMSNHHPEGNVLVHSLQVFGYAVRETNDVDLALGALVHDVGKIKESKGHESIGCELLKSFVSVKILFLIKNHMRIWFYLKGEMKKLSRCIWLANHPWMNELIQLARWDHKGRNPNMKIIYDKKKIVDQLNNVAEKHFFLPEHLRNYEGICDLKG